MKNLIYQEISPSSYRNSIVIFLHGLGGSANDTKLKIQQLSSTLGTHFIIPEAPKRQVTVRQNSIIPAWYDILEIEKYGKEDKPGIIESQKLIHNLLDYACSMVDPSQVFIAGFSQGGAMALYSGLTYTKKLGGIVCISGYVPIHKELKVNTSQKNTPVLIMHGTKDDVVPFEFGNLSYKLLLEMGLNVEMETYNTEHYFGDSELKFLSWFLKLV